jgi:Ca-activated chloride channel family protein
VIDLGQASWLLLFVIVEAMAVVIVWLARWQRRARERFAGGQVRRWPRAIDWHRPLLLIVAASLTVVAAARPQWGDRELSRDREGVDLVIALDISSSMAAQDVAPSRLALAQTEIVRLVEAQRGNRVGLVFFAGTAILRSPLTTDTQAILQLIQRADRESGLTRAGSDLGAALDQALRILAASESDGKAILVISDGEDHVSSFAGRLPALREQNIAVFAAGTGTPDGGTIQEVDPRSGLPRLKLDATGRPVITRLNESTLTSLAEGGGGRYLRLGPDASLVSFTDDFAALAQTPLGAEVQRVPIERFQWFAGAAFVILCLAWLLPERIGVRLPRRAPRLRPSPGIAVALIALLVGACGGGDSLREDNARANQLYSEGDFESALNAYTELLSQRPDVPELSFNVGNTLHRLGEYERAVAETQRALPPDYTQLGAVTYYALGNHFFALNELEQAYAAYRNALLLDPGDADAKFNLELTLLRLQAEQQPQEGQPGDNPQPGQPTPQEGTPQPGATPAPGQGEPQPGSTPQQPSPAELQRSLQEALQGIDEELTFEEAVEILELLRQQQERQRPAGAPGSTPTGPDY